MSSYSPNYNSLSRDHRPSSNHARVPSRSGASSGRRSTQSERFDYDRDNALTPGASPPAPAALQLATLFNTNSFARPSYAVPTTSHANPNATRTSSSNRGNSSSNNRRSEAQPIRGSRHDRSAGAPSPRPPSGRSRTAISPATIKTTTTGANREMTLVTPPPPPVGPQRTPSPAAAAAASAVGSSNVSVSGVGVVATGVGQRGASPRGRTPLRNDADHGRRSAGAAVGGSVGITGRTTTVVSGTATTTRSSSSPLYSTVTSSGSGTGPRPGGSASTSPPVNGGLNPLRPVHVNLEAAAEIGGGGNGASMSASPTTTTNSPALPLGNSKPHCSHCKVEDEALYQCPCGLARYCSTTCQRAHWSFHRSVCSSAVHAAELSWRRCDWCGTSSQTLRRCGCTFAYYCDTHCQRADWPYHRLVCSTAAAAVVGAVAVAVLPTSAPRARREASTQTTHWQISVPVLRSLVRSDGGVSESPGVSGYTSTSLPTSQQYGFTGSDSFGEARSFDGGATGLSSYPRSTRTMAPWDRTSQYPGESAFVEATSSNSRSGSATNGGNNSNNTNNNNANSSNAHNGLVHVDPAQRLSRTQNSSVSPRPSHSYNHPRTASFFESLHLATSERDQPSPSTTLHHRADTESSPTQSRGMAHSNMGFFKSMTLSGALASPSSRHSYVAGELDVAGDAGNANGTVAAGASSPGAVSNTSAASPSASFSPLLRDQPSLLAFAATSQRKVENDERKEWAELCRQFHEERTSIELRMLPTAEEVERVAILKEEVMWCVVTGYPAAKQMKQSLLRATKK